MRITITILISIVLITSGCKRKTQTAVQNRPYPSIAEQRSALQKLSRTASERILDSLSIISNLEYLSAAATEGRKPGTAGHQLALTRIVNEMRNTGADSFGNSILHPFNGKVLNGTNAGTNVVGRVKGSTDADKYIVVTAHYDHLGKSSTGEIFLGADDNASGTAALLAMAKYFSDNPIKYSLVFVALDREESGLEGAYAFVQQYVPDQSMNVIMNINMDMIARSDKNELFVAGVFHYPSLSYLIENNRSKTSLDLLMGHDTGSQSDDWTTQSDHAAFHGKKIPFLYFGVEDHPDYHKVTDTFDKINYNRYLEACNLIAQVIKTVQ
jgi:hypothetical protein